MAWKMQKRPKGATIATPGNTLMAKFEPIRIPQDAPTICDPFQHPVRCSADPCGCPNRARFEVRDGGDLIGFACRAHADRAVLKGYYILPLER